MQLREAYERAKQKASSLGYSDDASSEKKKKRCERIAARLPLSRRLRPNWDEKALKRTGFDSIECEFDMSEKVWVQKERIRYSGTPIFAVRARKPSAD